MSNSHPEVSDGSTNSDVDEDRQSLSHTGRRRFLGYLIAAPTVAAAAQIGGSSVMADSAEAAIPTPPQPSDLLDLSDLLVNSAKPTSNLITVTVHEDGTASFELPRAEMGQGVTTAAAIMIAEELELPVEKVRVTLADARPELLFNQFTGGSAMVQGTYTAIRTAAAIAKGQLLAAAAKLLNLTINEVTAKGGEVIAGITGESLGFGELAAKGAVDESASVSVEIKNKSEFNVIGKPHNRIDALEAVTGRKKFALDLDVPDAKPTMICRPPSINGKVKKVNNAADVRKMPGITHVVTVENGVAVRGETFGQCIDAIRELDVDWHGGTADKESDETIWKRLDKAELPLAVPKIPLLAKTIDTEFTFGWRSNSALEPQCSVANVTRNHAEVWTSSQSPIMAKQEIASKCGLPLQNVDLHVTEGGGGFGRMMFVDAAVESAEVSQKMGAPIKLMWHRADDFRYGRAFPISKSRLRAVVGLNQVISFEHRYTGVMCDFSQGFGEILTEKVAKVPLGNYAVYSTTIFETTANMPYNFGVVTQLLNEIFEYNTFHTGAVRNVYSPSVVTAVELTVDQIAKAMGKDPYKFRREFMKDKRLRNVLDIAAKKAEWGKKLPKGITQGIACHSEYKSAVATVVELDTRPETVERPIREGVTGPRVRKVTVVVDVGLPINPRGIQAQMEGGTMEGIGQALTESLHLKDGLFEEGSWDDYHFTRQWNSPPELDVIVLEQSQSHPGGAGELAVAPAKAATAAAYVRATGKMPKRFPINHDDDFSFEPMPRIPSIPQSPTTGLKYTY